MQKSPLRQAESRIHRFGQNQLSLRADSGFGMPMNTDPMSAQDQGAFNNLRDTPVGSPTATPGATPGATPMQPPKAPLMHGNINAVRASQAAFAMQNQQNNGFGQMSGMQLGTLQRPVGMQSGGEVPQVVNPNGRSYDEMYGKTEIAKAPPRPGMMASMGNSLRGMFAPAQAAPVQAPAPVRREVMQQGNAPTTGVAPMALPRMGNGASFQTNAAVLKMGLRDGGDLRTGMGGHVPGSGSGDKIPAKYEPGEFVVSNDMLAKAPGLRESLRGLREQTLADKGMTVEQADAKALRYSKQGEGNVPEDSSVRRGLRQGQVWDGGPDTSGSSDPVRGGGNSGRHPQGLRQVEIHAEDSFVFPESWKKGPWNQGFKQQPNQGNPNVGSGGSEAAKTWGAERAAQATAQQAADAAKTGARPFAPGAAPRPSSGWAGAAENVGSSAGNTAKAGARAAADLGTSAGKYLKANTGKALGRASNFLGVLPHLAAYGDDEVPFTDKLRIGATDLATAGGAALMGTVTGAAGNVFAPVVGTVAALPGAVVGGIGGHNVGDWLFGGDDALRRNKYDPDHGIVESLKDLASGRGVGAALGSKQSPLHTQVAAPTQQPKAIPTASAEPKYDNTRPNAYAQRQGDPSDSDLKDPFSNMMIQARNPNGAITRSVGANGTIEFSGGNVSGETSFVDANGVPIKGRSRGVSVMPLGPAAAQGQVAQNGGGDEGMGYEPAMSPLRARLESLGSQPGKLFINQAKILAQLQGQDRQHDASMASTAAGRKNNAASNKTAERGQNVTREGNQLSYDASVLNHKLTRDSNLLRMDFDNKWKNREFGQKQAEQDFSQSQAARKTLDDQAEKMYPAIDGKPDPRAEEYKQFTTNAVALLTKRLSESKNPTERAKATAMAAPDYVMDASDRKAIQQYWATRELAKKSSGWMPGSGHYVDSLNPEDFEPVNVDDSRAIGSDHIQLRNGSHIPDNDATGRSWLLPNVKGRSSFDDLRKQAILAQQQNQGR